MASRLEEKIVAAHGASDPLWMPLLGAWLAAFRCIRFRHLERSVAERISQSTVHCYCKKGKQASHRGGFHWFDWRVFDDVLVATVWTHTGVTVAVGAPHVGAWGLNWAVYGYAASKYTLSLRAKHAILSGARDLHRYQSWEEIPPEALQGECAAVAADVVAEALRLDCFGE